MLEMEKQISVGKFWNTPKNLIYSNHLICIYEFVSF